MAFVVKWVILSVLTFEINAGDVHGRKLDPYQVSDLPAPSDTYGFPAENFVAPPVDYNRLPENYYGNQSPDHYYGNQSPGQSHPSPVGENLTPPENFYAMSPHGPSSPSFDHPVNYQGHAIAGSFGSLGIPNYFSRGIGFGNENGNGRNSLNGNSQSPPRFVGETVRVGKPLVSSSRVVYKDVVTKIPVEVTRHIEVDVPQPVPVPVRQEIRVPVPEAYPVVSGEVINNVPYTVYKTQSYEVERPVPYEVVREVPYSVIKRVKVNIDKPYTVWKKVHVPVKKHVEVPVTVWKPYPVDLIKHVTHYKKDNCCW